MFLKNEPQYVRPSRKYRKGNFDRYLESIERCDKTVRKMKTYKTKCDQKKKYRYCSIGDNLFSIFQYNWNYLSIFTHEIFFD